MYIKVQYNYLKLVNGLKIDVLLHYLYSKGVVKKCKFTNLMYINTKNKEIKFTQLC